jgi:hypothetical protein
MRNPLARIKPSLIAAGLWFLLVFALGFALGTLRVLVTAPALGEAAATMVELPVMLAAGWAGCAWLVRRCGVGGEAPARWTMALVFFGLLMAAEQALGIFGFGRSWAEQRAAMTSLPALLGLAAQLVTASFPLWQGRHGG